jgi:hypothetical protein
MRNPPIEQKMTKAHVAMVDRWVADGVDASELLAKVRDLGYECSRPTAYRLLRDHKPPSSPPPPTPSVPPATDVHRTVKRAIRILEAEDTPRELKQWGMAHLQDTMDILQCAMSRPDIQPTAVAKMAELRIMIAMQINMLAEVRES